MEKFQVGFENER